jgi:ATP-dependent Clp protease ATP-binding subunit ClpA
LFEHYTERGKEAVLAAIREAEALGHGFCGTEHMVLGLASVDAGMAAVILASKGVTLEQLRAEVKRIGGQGAEQTTDQFPFSKHLSKALDLAWHETQSFNHGFLNTEHLLLGVTRDGESVGARMLLNLAELDYPKARKEVEGFYERAGGRNTPPKDPAKHIEIRYVEDGKVKTVLADPGTAALVLAPEGFIPSSSNREEDGRHGLAVGQWPARTEV